MSVPVPAATAPERPDMNKAEVRSTSQSATTLNMRRPHYLFDARGPRGPLRFDAANRRGGAGIDGIRRSLLLTPSLTRCIEAASYNKAHICES